MRAYVDSSVLLRVVLAQPNRLRAWRRITRPVASEIIRTESLRTLDRARHRFRLSDEEILRRRVAVMDILATFDLIKLGPTVLERASDPFPTEIGTLDAVHLASAILLRPRERDFVFATHDAQLAIAAAAMGFRVIGS